MPINNNKPVTIPAVSRKVMPHLWVYNLSIHAPNPQTGTLQVDLRPHDANTNDIANAEFNERAILPYWEVIENVPEAAAAMQAVFDAIPAIRTYAENR